MAKQDKGKIGDRKPVPTQTRAKRDYRRREAEPSENFDASAGRGPAVRKTAEEIRDDLAREVEGLKEGPALQLEFVGEKNFPLLRLINPEEAQNPQLYAELGEVLFDTFFVRYPLREPNLLREDADGKVAPNPAVVYAVQTKGETGVAREWRFPSEEEAAEESGPGQWWFSSRLLNMHHVRIEAPCSEPGCTELGEASLLDIMMAANPQLAVNMSWRSFYERGELLCAEHLAIREDGAHEETSLVSSVQSLRKKQEAMEAARKAEEAKKVTPKVSLALALKDAKVALRNAIEKTAGVFNEFRIPPGALDRLDAIVASMPKTTDVGAINALTAEVEILAQLPEVEVAKAISTLAPPQLSQLAKILELPLTSGNVVSKIRKEIALKAVSAEVPDTKLRDAITSVLNEQKSEAEVPAQAEAEAKTAKPKRAKKAAQG